MHKKTDSPKQTDFFSQLASTPQNSVSDNLMVPSLPESSLVQRTMPLDPPQDFNREIAGGVTLTRLKEFAMSTLEAIFCGMHNLQISPEILKRLNPSELLSAYFAAGSNKYTAYLAWNKDVRGVADEEIRNRMYAEQLIRLGYPKSVGDFLGVAYEMNKFSFRHPGFRFKALKMKNVLGRHEKERLETVPEVDAEIFTKSFYAPYVPSNKQDNRHPHCFHDPNYDGEDKYIYASRIYHQVRDLYRENEEHFLQQNAARYSKSPSISKPNPERGI